VVSRELRGENGAYTWLDAIRKKFEGYTPSEAAGHLELESENFAAEDDGIWQFVQKWNLKERTGYEQLDPYADRPLGS
jgi:hypothetical protein